MAASATGVLVQDTLILNARHAEEPGNMSVGCVMEEVSSASGWTAKLEGFLSRAKARNVFMWMRMMCFFGENEMEIA